MSSKRFVVLSILLIFSFSFIVINLSNAQAALPTPHWPCQSTGLSGESCLGYNIVGGLGADCGATTHCSSGFCSGGKCAGCQSVSDCGGFPNVCNSPGANTGWCSFNWPRQGLGSECNWKYTCTSGQCLNSYCNCDPIDTNGDGVADTCRSGTGNCQHSVCQSVPTSTGGSSGGGTTITCPTSCGQWGCVSGTSTCNPAQYVGSFTVYYYRNYNSGQPFPTSGHIGTDTVGAPFSNDWGEDWSADCSGMYEWCDDPDSDDDECPEENCCCPDDGGSADEPYSNLGTDNYAIKYIGDFNFHISGLYRFNAAADDAIRVYFDNELTSINNWPGMGNSVTTDIGVEQGIHNIRVEYAEYGGYSSNSFSFYRVGDLPPPKTFSSLSWHDSSGNTIPSAYTGDTIKMRASSADLNGKSVTFTLKKGTSIVNTQTISVTGNTAEADYLIPTSGGTGSYTFTASAPSFTSATSSALSVTDRPIVGSLTANVWNNLAGMTITNADKNDRVVMKVTGTQLTGKRVTFTWYKSGNIELGSETVLAQSDTLATYNTTITTDGTMTFKTNITATTFVTSPNLVVSVGTGNAAPVVNIVRPTPGGLYFNGSRIAFDITATDVDSNITSVSWDFGDGNVTNLTSFSTAHTYNTLGRKNIILRVKDEQDGETRINTNVMIVNYSGYTIVGNINTPRANAAILNNAFLVGYDAGDSYIFLTTTTGTCNTTIQCIQGKCPSTTQGSPSCASNPATTIPISGSPQGYADINFTWNFRDGNSMLIPETGYGRVSGTKGFADYGPKNITLEIVYRQPSIRSADSKEFTLFNQRQCSQNGATWYNISNGLISNSYSTLNSASCAGLDGQADTGDDCCPVGFMCSTSGSSPGCVVDNGANLGCSGYAVERSCQNDASQRVKSDVLWNYEPYHCGKIVNGITYGCACAWDNNKCVFNASSRGISGQTTSCTYVSTTGTCVDGYQQVTIDAQGNDPLCTDSVQTIPCGRPVVALPFFGTIQIITSIFGVIFVYLMFSRFVSRK